jgi:hypothetical protein
MPNPESPSETPTFHERRILYGLIQPWLEANGTHVELSNGSAVGNRNGKFVRGAAAYYECGLPGTVIRQNLPKSAIALAIGAKLRLRYEPGYWLSLPDEQVYEASGIEFAISRRVKTDGKLSEKISMSGPDAGNPYMTARTVDDSELPPTTVPFEARIKNIFVNADLALATGVWDLDSSEYNALVDIALNLDELHSATR